MIFNPPPGIAIAMPMLAIKVGLLLTRASLCSLSALGLKNVPNTHFNLLLLATMMVVRRGRTIEQPHPIREAASQ